MAKISLNEITFVNFKGFRNESFKFNDDNANVYGANGSGKTAIFDGFSKTLYVPLPDMAEYAKKYSPSISKTTTVEQLVEMANKGGAKKVGWEGNFNDMALKTVVRRLLSKYGYLSVEMQSALVKDIDSEVERNEQITEEANVEIFDDFDEVIDKEKAVVDSTTGEVLVAVENEPF